MTTIPVQIITPADVRASVKRAKASLEEAAEEIVWQIEHEAWVTLGYRSWDAMREAEYGGAAFMVPSRKRPELVARMEAKGLSQREIARTAGVGVGTVNRDLSGVPNGTPDAIEPDPKVDRFTVLARELDMAAQRLAYHYMVNRGNGGGCRPPITADDRQILDRCRDLVNDILRAEGVAG